MRRFLLLSRRTDDGLPAFAVIQGSCTWLLEARERERRVMTVNKRGVEPYAGDDDEEQMSLPARIEC